MSQSAPTFAVMGAGAIGAYFGGRLAAAGAEVAFVARGDHLAAMRANGLTILSPLADVTLDAVTATDDPAKVGPVDYVLFMVKLYDTREAARRMAPMIGPETAVVTFQNGVDVEARFGDTVAPGHLMGGAAYIPAAIEAPGVVRHGGPFARLVFGELGGGASPRAGRLRAAFEAAGVRAEVADDTDKALWTKFVMLAAFSAATGLARLPIGPIWAETEGRAMVEAAMREAEAVGRGLGVALDADVVDKHLEQAAKLPADMKSSLLQDLERGKRLEVADLSGAVVRLGAGLGIATPVHATALAALKPHADGPPAGVA
jgi:2-dehydropantoate 2-reductase